MRGWVVVVVSLLVLPVAACAKKDETPAAVAHEGIFAKLSQKGRFVGVGLYAPGEAWSQLKPPLLPTKAPAPNPKPAGLEDDEVVIVVANTVTGEVRQCGNLSGHCVALKPWAGPADAAGPAPLHAPIPEPTPQPMGRPPRA